MNNKWIIAVMLTILLTATAIASFLAARNGFAGPALNRAYSMEAALLASVAIALFAFFTIFGPFDPDPPIATKSKPTDDRSVKPAIAFNLTVFIAAGFAATVAATRDWPIASIWGGAMLLIGGVIGLIFSLPVSVSTIAAPKPTPHAQATSPPSPSASPTVLTQIAGTVVATLSGAILVKLKDLFDLFKEAARTLAKGLDAGSVAKGLDAGSVSLAAGLIAYFLALGFIAGLVLPQYFLQRVREALGLVRGTRP